MISIEKNKEHEREKKYVDIEEKILSRLCRFMNKQKVHLFSHANAK